MAGEWIRCCGRGHQWHNGWDEDEHRVLWTCKRCGKERHEEARGTRAAGHGGTYSGGGFGFDGGGGSG